MARTSLTTQKITRTGLNAGLTGPPNIDGDVIDVGASFLEVANASGASINVTVQTPVTLDGLDLADLVVAVPAGASRRVGPFPARTFAQPSGSPDAGRAYVNYSSQASITRGVFSL